MAGDVDTSDYLASARDKGDELMRTVHEGDQTLVADPPLIVSDVLNPKWYSQQNTQQSNKRTFLQLFLAKTLSISFHNRGS